MIIRITREDNGEYVEGRIDDDSGYDQVAEVVDGLMVAYGFQPDTVKDWRPEEISELSEPKPMVR